MDHAARARLQILAAAALFSTGGAAVKACSLTGWQVAGFRSGLGALALLLLVPGARRAWTWRTLLVGAPYAATLLLYVQANKLTTATNAIFLQSTAPLYLLLLSPLLLRERIRAGEIALLATLAAGLSLFLLGREPWRETAPEPALGNLVGAASGATWALTVAGLRWLARRPGGSRAASGEEAAAAAVAGNALVFLACLPFALGGEAGARLTEADLGDALWVAYLGVLQIALAYVFMTRGLRRVRALEGSLLLLLEPVLNPVWAWLLHGEVPGAWSRLGAVLILAATVGHALRAARRSDGGAGP